MTDRSSWPRRLIMPIAILAVAAGLAWWGSRLESDQHFAVHVFVRSVCDDVLEGRDPTPRLAATDELVRDTLVRRLQEVLDPNAKLTIEVAAGDSPDAGSATGTATHIATLKLDGTPALRLRVAHGAKPTDIAIIGFF